MKDVGMLTRTSYRKYLADTSCTGITEASRHCPGSCLVFRKNMLDTETLVFICSDYGSHVEEIYLKENQIEES